jgi:glutathione S-transferase
MTDFTLLYWPIPFRGQFIRAVLAYVGASWTEVDFDAIWAERAADPSAQRVPHMGPPVLTDHRNGAHISQMPAILFYLGEEFGLFPTDPALRAMCHKVIGDCNDVLYEMTRHNGDQMWTKPAWDAFQPRLARWMGIFEATGHRHGLTAGSGFLLGTDAPGLADLVTATLWGTMTAKLPPLRLVLDAQAPAIAGLSDRIGAIPSQVALCEQSDAAYGEVWCGGQIEASLRRVIRARAKKRVSELAMQAANP